MPNPSAQIGTQDPSRSDLEALVALQRESFLREGNPTAETRRNRIDRLMAAVLRNSDAIVSAIAEDFGRRPKALSLSVDVLGVQADAEDIRANLESWMADVPLSDGPDAVIQQRPLGVVAVIGAWNFPATLVVQPAIAALAAGNRVVLKMPSASPRTAAALSAAISFAFLQEEVAVVSGEGRVNDDFVSMRFDHIMFTGSPEVGSIIQQAASKNLVPVTLELGGKNPVVVTAAADLDIAADRVAVSRMANGGQICVCGDYVLVHRTVAASFVEKISRRLRGYFPTYADNPTAVSLINDRAYERVLGLIHDAVAKGARKVEIVADSERDRLPDPVQRLIAPTLLLEVPSDAEINTQEIFGPVLPIYLFDDIEEVIRRVNSAPSPLAAYWYGPDDDDFDRFCTFTTSGGVTRNDGFLHSGIHGAPFGGVGRSGYGAYHGKAGFDAFTHRRTIASSHSETSVMGALVGARLESPELNAALGHARSELLGLWQSRVDAHGAEIAA